MKVEVKLSKKTEKIIRQWGNMRKGGAGGYRDEHDQHTKYICMSTLKWIDLNFEMCNHYIRINNGASCAKEQLLAAMYTFICLL